MLPGQIHAPLCAATLELHFEIVEYLKGTGPTRRYRRGTDETLVPGRTTDSCATCISKRRLSINAAEWWSRRSSVWDDGLAVLFLKRDEYDEVDLTFTERSWGYDHYYLGGPQEYERSWLPSVGEDFVPPPVTFGRLWWLEQEHGDEAPLTGDGSAPRFVSVSGPSREGPAPVVISLADLRSRLEEFSALLDRGRDIPDYQRCIRHVLFSEASARTSREPPSPYRHERVVPSGLPSGTVVQRSNRFGYEVLAFENIWLEGPDADVFELVKSDAHDIEGDGYFELLTALRPLPFGEYMVERHYDYPVFRLCSDFKPNGFVLIQYDQWTISVEASIEGTVHEAFFDPASLGNGSGFSEEGGVLRPAAFTAEELQTDITGLIWQQGTISHEPGALHAGRGLRHRYSRPRWVGAPHAACRGSVNRPRRRKAELEGAQCQPWRAGDTLMLRIRSEGPAPATPGPRPWVPEVLDLTATAGTRFQGWLRRAEDDSRMDRKRCGYEHLRFQPWTGPALGRQHRRVARAPRGQCGDNGHAAARDTYTSEALYGIRPGPYTIRVRYTAKPAYEKTTIWPITSPRSGSTSAPKCPASLPIPEATPTPEPVIPAE